MKFRVSLMIDANAFWNKLFAQLQKMSADIFCALELSIFGGES